MKAAWTSAGNLGDIKLQQSASDVVYQGYTQEELAAQYAVHASVPDLGAYMKESGELAAKAREEFPGIYDIPYGKLDIQKLDIYAPANAANAPVLIDIHGGGWTQGSKDTRSINTDAITSKGVIWVPIDYGLAPDHSMTEIVDHVRQAVAWVYKNIAEYGGDPNRIYVSGNSAGGHLTATTTMPGWHAGYGIPADTIKGACAMSGVYDLNALVLQGSEGPNGALKMDDETAYAMSPEFHINPDSGPLVIGVGEPELDEFKRQSLTYAEACSSAGLDVSVVMVPGAHHFAMSREFANTDGELYKAVTTMMGV
jgi:arylformamidase